MLYDAPVTSDHWLQHRTPAIGAVHIAGPPDAALNIAKLVEYKQRILILLRQKFVSSGVNFRDTLKKRCVEGTGHERGPTGTVWRLYRGARRSGRARGSNGAVAGLLPGLAAAGRTQERRADRGGDGAGPSFSQAPVVAAFRRQRAVVG